ncbi:MULTISPECIES: hypothetical protein [unclassified Flavobacterium]|uniref:hypothetical protein n=1 Tax=unclassified Flavobacterium TaxID=196869 RepID=UPI000F0C4679|nr:MULTISPECIES: hypothetical protein [unclassified Flavobacterium]AYN05925.1 hypothetical protein EAG11_18480 [Flavobacterium sp. 140616W15]MCD0475598.1 hypothetical protein [Flavobacterium sp. EDS]
MKESDKYYENLVDKVMAEGTMQKPSADFTSRVMSQVLVLQKTKRIVYKPLISKSVWAVIFGSLVVFIGYVVFAPDKAVGSDLSISTLCYSKIDNLIPVLQFSKNTSYAVLIVVVMVLVQISLLKNYYDKKYRF